MNKKPRAARQTDRTAVHEASKIVSPIANAAVGRILNVAKASQNPPPDEPEVECECCFDDCNFEDMVSCNHGHLFCTGCMTNYVNEQLFGKNRSELKCLSSEEGCDAGFSDVMLQKALSPSLCTKVNEHIYRSEVAKAHDDDLWYVLVSQLS